MATVSVRYIVHDVDAAIDFYCRNLGFAEVMHPAPTFAMLSRGDLRLVLSAAGGGPRRGHARIWLTRKGVIYRQCCNDPLSPGPKNHP